MNGRNWRVDIRFCSGGRVVRYIPGELGIALILIRNHHGAEFMGMFNKVDNAKGGVFRGNMIYINY